MQLSRACLAAPLVAGLAACCTSGRFVEVGSVTGAAEPIEPPRSLRIENPLGGVRVVPSSSSRVEVEARVAVREPRLAEQRARGAPAFEDHVVLETAGNELVVRSRHDGDPDEDDWRLELLLAVPGQPALAVVQGVGDVDVEMAALRALRADVGVGTLRADVGRLEERLEGEVGVGDLLVHITERAPAEGGWLESGTGSVTLALPEGAEGAFDLSTGVGSIEVAPRYGLRAESAAVSATARGTVGEAEASWRVRAGVGDITLR